MSETVESIANDLSDEVGLPRYGNIIGNTETNARKMLKAIKDGLKKDVYRDGDWRMLQKSDSISVLGGGVVNYSLADDFGRIVNDTIWDETNYNKVRGPVDLIEWQAFNKGLAQLAGLELVCIILGDPDNNVKEISFYPDTSAATVSYYYVSNKPVISSDGTAKTDITADDDGFLVPDELVYAASRWRLLRMLGLSFQDELAEYNSLLDEYLANDTGGKKIRMDRKMKYNIANVPEVGYGS